MSQSQEYRELQKSLRVLRKSLLPRRFDPTGSYRSQQRVHLRAVSFRLLVHAEIETFIEDRALDLFSDGWRRWSDNGVPSGVAIGLLAYWGGKLQQPPKRLGGDPENQKAYDDVSTPMQDAQKAWRHSHQHNNGIREENVLRLLLPLGIASTELDATLLADLTSYGADRGRAAHSSPIRLQQMADPEDEYRKARQLVEDIRKLDDCLTRARERLSRLARALT